MAFKIDKKQYVDYTVYSVTTIKSGYGFRVKLVFDDESEIVQQRSGFRTKTEAKKERELTVAQLFNKTYIVYPNVKVEDYYIYWLEDYKKPDLKYGSYMAYRNAIYNYIIPIIGGYKMSTLNQSHIQKLYNKVAQQYHSVAKLVKTIMNCSLSYAKDKGVVSVNAATDVNLPKCVKPKEYRKIIIDKSKTLSLSQCIALIKASKETPIYMQVLFAVLTGMRTSEVLGVKYTDIDYTNRKLYIQRQLGVDHNKPEEETVGRRSTQEIDTKTPSGNRCVGLTDILFEEIIRYKNEYFLNKEKYGNEFNDEQFIICSNKGKPRCRTSHNKCWKKLKKELKLPNIKFHDLRHTYGTLLLKANFNLKAISELLGHASEIITYDVYIDKDEIVYDCLDVLEEYIDSVVEEEYDYGHIFDFTGEDEQYDYAMEMFMDTIIDREYEYGHIFIHTDLDLDTHFSPLLKEEVLI